MAKRTKKDEIEADEDRIVIVEHQPEMEQPIEPEHADESPDESEQSSDADPQPLVHARDLVTVKFIGSNCAVLGNATILHGETRANVSRAMLARAEQAHPGEFGIIEG